MELNQNAKRGRKPNEMRGKSGNKYNAPFPTNLRELMKEKEISEEEMAEYLEVSKTAIVRYQTGDSGVSMSTLAKISKKLDVSTDYLLGLTSVRPADEDLKMIEKYTGLSGKSITALHYLHDAPSQSPVRHTARTTIRFINRVFRDYLEKDDQENASIVFSFLEEWITGCGFAETLEDIMSPSFTHRSLLNSMNRVDLMRVDDVFRSVTMANIMKCLEDLAEKDGTFAKTLEESQKSPGDRYSCSEDDEDDDQE